MSTRKVMILTLGLCLITSLLIGCSENKDEPEAPIQKPEVNNSAITLDSSIQTSGLSFDTSASEKPITFSTTSDWSLSIAETRSGPEWCTASPTSGGKGTTTVKFKTTENTDAYDRSVAVTIKAGTASKTFNVTQKGNKSLLVTTKKYELPKEGGEIEIEVKSNVEYEMMIAESAKEWITEVSGRALTTHKHILAIAASQEAVKREGIITFKSGDIVETVKVYQAGEAVLLLSQNEFNVSDTGETISIDIKSNVEFGVQMPEVDWIKEDVTGRGMSSHTLKYTIAPNEENKIRSADIVFYDKNSALKDTLKIQQGNDLIIGISEDELDNWEEGFLVTDELFFATKEDSVGGTLAYLNKLNQNFEDGLLVQFNSGGVISQIFDHEYIHSLNFTDDSLYVTSVPIDTISNLPIKNKNVAFSYKDYCNVRGLSRVSSKTMDRLAMYYFLHSTGVKVEISDKEVWKAVGQAIVEEAIGEGLEKGVVKVAGKVAGGLVGTCLLAYDAMSLIDEVKTYTYFGHARLNVTGYNLNPDEFALECENFNTLPSPSKYGLIYPFNYECGVLLDGEHHLGPFNFQTSEIINVEGTYEIPELSEGYHTLEPYILCKDSGQKIIGKRLVFEVRKEVIPEYSVKTKTIYEDGEDIKVVLDFSWTPVQNSLIEYQGISFIKPNGEKFCLDLSTYTGGNAGVSSKTEGRISKSDFSWDGSVGISYIKIAYWVKYRDKYETKSAFLENYEVVYEEDGLREALIKLYQSTNGDNWTNNTNWCSDKPVEEWYGVSKNEKGEYSINLNNNNLTGVINQEFPACVVGLECCLNLLTSIKVSNSLALKTLDCSNNKLTSLDVSDCTSLNWLDKYNNPLISIDISGCIAFNYFNCEDYQQLISLNVSGCTSLAELRCKRNQLTTLNISGCTVLTILDCQANQLTTLNVSNCSALKILLCSNNPLSSLDVSGLVNLEDLCFPKQLTSLNASKCIELNNLSCAGVSHAQLTSLDVSDCTALQELSWTGGQLKALNVSGCMALRELRCPDNQLTTLNVLSCSALESLDCSNNPMPSLDVSGLKNLSYFLFPSQLIILKASRCTTLKTLSCDICAQLTSLDVSDCTGLIGLSCSNTQLSTLNVSGCISLHSLSCNNNLLTSLDVSECKNLWELSCHDNKLTSLDVSNLRGLTTLYCENNELTSLNPTTSLRRLDCQNNRIFQEIPNWFSVIRYFNHDRRYEYYMGEEETIKYKDNGVGWWYAGEPETGCHCPL